MDVGGVVDVPEGSERRPDRGAPQHAEERQTVYSGEVVQNGKGTELKVAEDGTI